MSLRLVFAATLALGSGAAWAQDAGNDRGNQRQEAVAASTAPQADEEEAFGEEDPGDEIICRTERVTGSLTRRTRTCMTRDEWNGVHADTRDAVNRLNSNASGAPSCAPGPMGGC